MYPGAQGKIRPQFSLSPPAPRAGPLSERAAPLLRKALLGLPIGDGGMKGGATYRFRSETAMLAWSGCP
jgi:hypothetical protein